LLGPARVRHLLWRHEAFKKRPQREVVLLQDRIELVIVATSAADAQTHERLPGDIDDVAQHFIPLATHVSLVELVNAMSQEPDGDQSVGVVGNKARRRRSVRGRIDRRAYRR